MAHHGGKRLSRSVYLGRIPGVDCRQQAALQTGRCGSEHLCPRGVLRQAGGLVSKADSHLSISRAHAVVRGTPRSIKHMGSEWREVVPAWPKALHEGCGGSARVPPHPRLPPHTHLPCRHQALQVTNKVHLPSPRPGWLQPEQGSSWGQQLGNLSALNPFQSLPYPLPPWHQVG